MGENTQETIKNKIFNLKNEIKANKNQYFSDNNSKNKSFMMGLKLRSFNNSESQILNPINQNEEINNEEIDYKKISNSSKDISDNLHKKIFNVVECKNEKKIFDHIKKKKIEKPNPCKETKIKQSLSINNNDPNIISKNRLETVNEDCSLNRLNNNNKYNKVQLIILDESDSNRVEFLDKPLNSDFLIKDYQNIEIISKFNHLFLNEDAPNKINFESGKSAKTKHEKNSSKNLLIEDNIKNFNILNDKKKLLNENSNKKKRIGSEISDQYNNYDEYYFYNKFNTERFQIKRAVKSHDFRYTAPGIDNFAELRKEFFNEIKNFDIIPKIKFSKEYFLTPIIKDQTLICKIKIHTSKNKFGSLYPIYTLHAESSDKFILAAKKVNITSTSSYIFSLDKNNFDVKSEHYLGKLNSNFLGTKFKIFDYKDKYKNDKNFIEKESSKELNEIDYVKHFNLNFNYRK